LVGYGPIGDLATEMAFQYKIEDGPKVRKMLKQMNEAQLKLDVLRSNLMRIGQDHYQNYKCSI
ncbi:hypothetical protein, partial [Klebsiella pneumoniae]|uniref:hypothetical protein n=1 Tax=Klebsiella pneumoniae TaxID=573 RepID=UPI00200E8892